MIRTIAASLFCIGVTVGLEAGLEASLAEGREKSQVHVVASGETLWDISRGYGCDVNAIKKANKLANNLIRPGQKLAIPRCSGRASKGGRGAGGSKGSSAGRSFLTHYVMAGDTLIHIAKRYDTTVKDIKGRNKLRSHIIRPGQKLRVMVGKDGRGRAIPGQSVGESDGGKLINGMQLPRGRGYYRRRPERAWGANHTVFHIRRAISVVRSRFPKVHDLAIGDISRRKGGQLARHKSHQSGRDADIGFYFTKRPKGYPQSFVKGTTKTLHMKATWALLQALANTAGAPGGVEKMFLDYELQKVLYDWAKKRRVKKATLERMFQYPRAKYTSYGIIRHEPGHSGHVHVRFKCPKGDDACKP